MRYRITHRTIYEYTEPVTVSHNTARLKPSTGPNQCLSEFDLRISPQPDRMSWRHDYFGNTLAIFSIRELHTRVDVCATSLVEVIQHTPPVASLSALWTDVAERFKDPVSPQNAEVYEYCMDSPMVRTNLEFAEWSRISFPKTATLLSGTSDLMARLFSEFTFDSEATEVATPLEDVWKNRRGVCQDFAHIAIACLRSLGLPARYVSGYLRTIPPPGQERLQGADASHAWISTYCPVHGWTDFDPTNNLMPSDSHVRVAVGRDYSDVSPLIGVLSGGGSHIVRVEVDVVPHD
jgi:transglutaminase-like putative cysteine protease